MATNDKTIIYYTANTEDPVFESCIRDRLVKQAGNIPIISVSRKPIDLGANICVGEKPVSYTSEWKQLLLGLKTASTKYCIAAEADCIYPPEYFNFTPPEDDMMYNYNNIWIYWTHKGNFWKKTGYCEGAQICDREYWIKQLEPLLPKDWSQLTREQENELVKKIFPTRREFTGDPVVSFKTRMGVSYRTTFINDSKTKELPYWGSVEAIKEEFHV
jgi:hypothetical protein